MKFNEILKILSESSYSDWETNQCENIYQWETNSAPQSNPLMPLTHSNLAVYKDDVDITLVWGAKIDDFRESWTDLFTDKSAYTIAIELRYRGVVIQSWFGVRVDGSRYLLPLPSLNIKRDYEINRDKLQEFWELIFRLDSHGESSEKLATLLKTANINVK